VKLISVQDLEDKPTAETMADCIIWALTESCELDMDNCIYFNTDNTSSMSGVGAVGGCVEIIRRTFGLAGELPRAPCALHAWHIGLSKAREQLYFGPMPAKLDRKMHHLWNFLWALYNLFGRNNAGFYHWQRMCRKAGRKLTITFKPVATRWLFEAFGATWALQNLLLIRWLYEEVPLFMQRINLNIHFICFSCNAVPSLCHVCYICVL
jgi:hypothetical protein